MSLVIPTVIEKWNQGSAVTYDLYSRLLKDRIIFVGGNNNGNIDLNVANSLIAQLLYLDSESTNKTIHLYINSPGGMVSAGLAIYDTMMFVKSPISTICIGIAMSFGAILLLAGTKGKRYALSHSRIMIHQPLIYQGSLNGTVSDINIETQELIYIKQMIVKIISKHTGRSIKQVLKDIERNYYMSAQEAKSYGIIDEIIINSK
ncbi:MAG: ATP-dependent Clp protease proteolytic subunit [Endomicrobium sp.]|jgi:ATP-dependent Clp protease protease subunit|nr:ATP-dependent Clp protease proteolytic subunit [Endomicrobium sp.]